MYLQRRPDMSQRLAAHDFMQHVDPLQAQPVQLHYAQRMACCDARAPRQPLGGVFDALSSLGFIQEFLRS